ERVSGDPLTSKPPGPNAPPDEMGPTPTAVIIDQHAAQISAPVEVPEEPTLTDFVLPQETTQPGFDPGKSLTLELGVERRIDALRQRLRVRLPALLTVSA